MRLVICASGWPAASLICSAVVFVQFLVEPSQTGSQRTKHVRFAVAE